MPVLPPYSDVDAAVLFVAVPVRLPDGAFAPAVPVPVPVRLPDGVAPAAAVPARLQGGVPAPVVPVRLQDGVSAPAAAVPVRLQDGIFAPAVPVRLQGALFPAYLYFVYCHYNPAFCFSCLILEFSTRFY